MRKLIQNIQTAMANFGHVLLDDEKRIRLQFVAVYCALAAVSLFMTFVNIFTQKHALMLSTLAFGILCCVNVLLAKRGNKALRLSGWLFSAEMLALLTFFVISGTPEGFSAIWACMVPASGLLLFRRKYGTLLCAIMLLVLIFFLETPLGNSFLQYRYTDSFKLRFPMLYLAFFAISFLLETIRAITFDQMRKAQEKYEFLYRHDALTGLYNRYGFNERMDRLLSGGCPGPIALLILDLDNFKLINDEYGHPFGDVMLQVVADLLVRQAGPGADVCRWGGEEFAIMLCGERDPVECGWRIIMAMREVAVPAADAKVSITASIGVAAANTTDGLTPAALVRCADKCLYSAKGNGRDTLVSAVIPHRGAERPQAIGVDASVAQGPSTPLEM